MFRIATFPVTTAEVKLCCSDLRVLGRKEFRSLLKWKATVQKTLEKASTPSFQQPALVFC